MASQPLRKAGFEGEALDIMLGIEWVECYEPISKLHYYDAVGDLGSISDIWGPSIGAAQIRSLRDPLSGNEADRWRVASALRDPWYNAQAAWEISNHGTDYMKWTPFRPDRGQTYLPHKGVDFELHAGHPNAHLWDS
jgi:Lysozyme like domain